MALRRAVGDDSRRPRFLRTCARSRLTDARASRCLGVGGRVTLKLVEVPWDQAFDLLTCANGLTWTWTGDVIHVEVRKTVSSR